MSRLPAQTKLNFTGKWTLVPDPTTAPPPGGAAGAGDGRAGAGGGRGGGRGGGGGGRGGGRGGAVGGAEVTMTQDATTLKVERVQGQNTLTLTYTLAGEGKNTMPGRQGGAGTDVTYKTAWEGSQFVITSTQSMTMPDGTPMTTTSKQALSIAADGTLLVENTSTPMGGGDPVTTKVTYKKG